MMKKFNFIFLSTVLFSLLSLTYSQELIEFTLDQAMKKSLPDKSYAYFKLKIPQITANISQFLLIEARRNVEQDLFDNVFSDPNLYISTIDQNPSPSSNTWSSGRFGDEIISIDHKYVKSGALFYMSVYCEFKCNFILDAKLYTNYELKEDKLYTLSMIPDDVMKITFKSKSKFEKLKVNCVSYKMKPFQVFLAKSSPSSSNSLPSFPIFLNGYYFTLKKGDPEYATNQVYEVLIENKEYKQDLLFWINYDDDDTEISELSPLFGSASQDSANCYSFNIDSQHRDKNIIISTTLFNGNGYIRIGGWEKVKDMKVKTIDSNTYPIISDKSILLTKKNFDNYGKVTGSNKLHFCFIATEETSYEVKVYYTEHAEMAQKLNYLLPGVGSDDMLPGKTITKYKLYYFMHNKDIKIEMKVKNGSPKLYLYYSFDENSYVNRTELDNKIKSKNIVTGTRDTYQKYSIKVNTIDNACYIVPSKAGVDCQMFAVVECSTDRDCLYEMFFDHIGNVINMKPKVVYSNVITEREIDTYQIQIADNEIENFAVILTQNTGTSKLKLANFTNEQGAVNLENREKYNKNYMPNVIEIKAADFPSKSIKGKFLFEVIGNSFSSYSIYYYTFDDSSSSRLDHKTISMPLIKGSIIKDYIKDNHNIKVYSYDNSNVGSKKTDLFIYFEGSGYMYYNLYVFKNLDDYSYERQKVKGFLWQSNFFNNILISKEDPNYVIGNLYIMVVGLRYEEIDDNSQLRKENSANYPFYLAITDETTPLNLLEGIEFRLPLSSKKTHQTFYYNHRDKDEDFALSISIPYSKIKIGLKLGEKEYIYQKTINGDYFLKIDSKSLYEYCPSSKSCNVELYVEAVNFYELEFDVVILCKSSMNSIVYLNKNSLIERRKIATGEKQYFVVEANPERGETVRISAIFENGRGELYAKRIDNNVHVDLSLFPHEDDNTYSSNLNNREELSIINIPYQDIEAYIPCKILVTVKGIFDYLGRSQGYYTLSLSNLVDDIFVNKNYRLYISNGEVKYYRFSVRGLKTRLSISMTNKEVDAFMYLNYENMDKEANEFQWKSEGSYNEYIDLSIEDPFFVSRRINSLEGEYYLAVRAVKDTYFNLFISDSNVKIMTISERFPGTCTCKKEGDFCYFRYENINSPEIAQITEQDLIFYFEFTYGTADIYASLFETGNNGIILQNLPTQYKRDYKSIFSNQYLRVHLTPGDSKYTLDSVLVLGTRCKSKSMFDFNVRPLMKSGNILQKDSGYAYLVMDRDNIFFISQNSPKPVNLTLYSITNKPITFEAKAISGSAEIHCYVYNDESSLNDNLMINKIKGYKHLSRFSVDQKDTKSHYDTISADNSFRQNIYFEIKAKTDCLFSIHIHYRQDIINIPMSKQTQGVFREGKFYAYFELLKEYDQVTLTVDKMKPDSQFSIYSKTSIVDSLNFKNLLAYSAPSDNNYDVKAKTNSFSPSVSLKIENLPGELYERGKKIITIIYIQAENDKTFNDKLNMIAYPNVDHFSRINPAQRKYIYSSLSSKDADTTVFSLKQQEYTDNILVIEISSCRGNFGYKLTNSLANSVTKGSSVKNVDFDDKGKKIIISTIQRNMEYYLSVYGLKEDEMLFSDYELRSESIDFLLYYYTTDAKGYSQAYFDSKLNYRLTGATTLLLTLPNLELVNSQGVRNKIDDLNITVIITQNKNEFDYMNSICYLSKKYDYIQENKLYRNYTITINNNKNEIQIENLERNQVYYLNVLITNKKTGQIFSLDPLQIKMNRVLITFNNAPIVLLLIGITILGFLIFYFYRKYRITKAIVNYQSNDIRNMGSIPKSITELKQMETERNKLAKEKYNSLTEDSGQI